MAGYSADGTYSDDDKGGKKDKARPEKEKSEKPSKLVRALNALAMLLKAIKWGAILAVIGYAVNQLWIDGNHRFRSTGGENPLKQPFRYANAVFQDTKEDFLGWSQSGSNAGLAAAELKGHTSVKALSDNIVVLVPFSLAAQGFENPKDGSKMMSYRKGIEDLLQQIANESARNDGYYNTNPLYRGKDKLVTLFAMSNDFVPGDTLKKDDVLQVLPVEPGKKHPFESNARKRGYDIYCKEILTDKIDFITRDCPGLN